VTSGSVRAPAIGGAFCLVDHNGQPVTERTYFGQFVLVFFGFTHCRVVCPRTLSMLSRTLEAIGTRSSQVQALYVTVDPERDVPQVLRKFLERSYPRFTGLTGELTQVEAMRSLYRVFAERRDESNGDYQMPSPTSSAHPVNIWSTGPRPSPSSRQLAAFCAASTTKQVLTFKLKACVRIRLSGRFSAVT
jgi:protein SCO1/2